MESKSKVFIIQSLSKCEIFDLFYSKQSVVRSGGGKVKNKMTRNEPSLSLIDLMEKRIKKDGNKKMLDYFNKLRTRNPNIAPPPRP